MDRACTAELTNRGTPSIAPGFRHDSRVVGEDGRGMCWKLNLAAAREKLGQRVPSASLNCPLHFRYWNPHHDNNAALVGRTPRWHLSEYKDKYWSDNSYESRARASTPSRRTVSLHSAI